MGYNTTSTDPDETGTARYPQFGFTFQPLNDPDGWVSLGSVKLENAEPYNYDDFIYNLSPDDATPAGEQYYYFSLDAVKDAADQDDESLTDAEAAALVGWWIGGIEYVVDSEARCDSLSFDAGTAFIGDFCDSADSGDTVVISFPKGY